MNRGRAVAVVGVAGHGIGHGRGIGRAGQNDGDRDDAHGHDGHDAPGGGESAGGRRFVHSGRHG